MIDTHTHVYLEEFDDDRAEVMQRATDAGVSSMIFPNVNVATIEPMLALHHAYPENTYIAMGLHPTDIDENYKNQLEITLQHLNANKCVAVGEIGIDLYWDKTFAAEQSEVFGTQIQWAYERNLPIIIHARDAHEAILEVFSKHKTHLPQGVFHSFTGTPAQVSEIRQYGDYFFGINGVVTFKNAHLEDTVQTIGIDRILLETDAPYLTPVPFRGRRNEPSHIPLIASRIAQILNISVDEVATATTANARKLFNI